MPPALGAPSPDYWTTKEVSVQVILKTCFSCFRENVVLTICFFILDSCNIPKNGFGFPAVS